MEAESLRRDNRQLLYSRQKRDDEGWRQCWEPLSRVRRLYWISDLWRYLWQASQADRGYTERIETRYKNRSYSTTTSMLGLWKVVLAITILGSLVSSTTAAFVPNINCLSENYINSSPKNLQFTPLLVDAVFDATNSSHSLHITIYGNVSGEATNETLPPASNVSYWENDNEVGGKITNVSSMDNTYSTLLTTFNVLSYTPYQAPRSPFCESLTQGHCPLAPVFWENGNGSIPANQSNPADLSAFSVAHDLYSAYIFTTITANLKVLSGDASGTALACISASITPDLGRTVSNLLTFLPALVLLIVGIATISAAIFSPWGTVDVFRWTSNYGRDADLLRLITPGFGDCLQYIQFVVLTGSLSLNYPGFYQPVVSRVGWSVLMFNESFVSHGNGTQSLVDGVYSVNATYGLDRMRQLVGMTANKDVWAGMMIWLLAITAALTVLSQLGFACRWIYRYITNIPEEDLRAKNAPFTGGLVIRLAFSYFLLPLVALSMFQFVIAGQSSAVTVGLAALTFILVICFTSWLLWIIASVRPRSYLFDDLPTLLLYGPLYNTFSDHAAAFALVPLLMTLLRGIAVGAVQPSGIAQLVLLAICEVISILTLNAFRPFQSPTSMNAIHTVFAVVRLVAIMLSVAFVPSLGVGDSPRGWIGYVILLMHAISLFVGFFLHSLQTIIEVIARAAGAGGEEGVGGGAARGGLVKVFGMRQLSRRHPRNPDRGRNSIASDAAMLGNDNDQKSIQLSGGRSRSMSASSAILLNQHPTSDGRRSMGLDSTSAAGGGHSHSGSVGVPYTPTTPGGTGTFSNAQGTSSGGGGGGDRSSQGGIVNLKSAEAADPYYRPPRARRVTMELNSPVTRNRGSWPSGDWAKRWSHPGPEQEGSPDPMEGPSRSGRATPLPAHLSNTRERSDSTAEDSRRSKTDYAIREVDFYYGVRGPALSNLPTRRLKTGPADPTGPVSSASGWFKSLFGGKTKDKGKGFEVVRSSRVPQLVSPSGEIALADQKPYKDDPDPTSPHKTRDFELDDEGDAVGGGTRRLPEDDRHPTPLTSDEEYRDETSSDEEGSSRLRSGHISQFPPSLPTIESGPEIQLPSRITSKASSRPSQSDVGRLKGRVPSVPRKSPRRTSSQVQVANDGSTGTRLSVIAPSPPSSPPRHGSSHERISSITAGLQPSSGPVQRLPFSLSPSSSKHHTRSSSGADSTISDLLVPDGEGDNTESRSYVHRPSDVLGSGAYNDRPSSLGYVQQHRASDNVHIANPNDQFYHESAAELIDDPTRKSISPHPEAHR